MLDCVVFIWMTRASLYPEYEQKVQAVDPQHALDGAMRIVAVRFAHHVSVFPEFGKQRVDHLLERFDYTRPT